MGVVLLVVPPMSPPVNFTLVADVKLKKKLGWVVAGGNLQVEEDIVGDVPVDAAPLVGHLDADVVFTLYDLNLDVRDLLLVLPGLHGGPHTVLEDLEEHVVEMAK